MGNIILKAAHVTKRYGKAAALQSVSLDIFDGDFFSLIGPSGSGKSTLLRILAGVEPATEGRVLYKGTGVSDVTSEWHDIVMVWQSLALFPHMNVKGNVAFGLVVRHMGREQIDKRVQAALTMVELGGFERRRIHELSGGEQQRVALARALVMRPKVLLLDEPLGSLDAYLRGALQAKLQRLHHETGVTFVMVTHDQSEALALSNRIAVINKGRIEQVGTPQKVTTRPQTAFVARFLGEKNVFEGTVEGVVNGTYVIKTNLGVFKAGDPAGQCGGVPIGSTVAYVIEASHIQDGNRNENAVNGVVVGIVMRGSYRMVRLQLPNQAMLMFEVYGKGYDSVITGSDLVVSWKTDNAYVLPS